MSIPTNASFEISVTPERNEITGLMTMEAELHLTIEVLDFEAGLRFIHIRYPGTAFDTVEAAREVMQNFIDDRQYHVEPGYAEGLLKRLKWSDIVWHTTGSEFWDKTFREVLEVKKQRGKWFQPEKML